MSRLEELIKELCPDGVEYKHLFEIGSFFGGLSGKSREDFVDGNVKFISYMNVYSNIAVNLRILDFVRVGLNERQNPVQFGDILLTGSSETVEECGFSSVITEKPNEPIYLNSFCFGLRLYKPNLLLPSFSKYLFRSSEVRKQIIRTASGVTRFNVSKKKMEQVLIPLPPLPVQEEIVRILDKFTALEAELEAELEARKKQYEYYREELISRRDNAEWKSLGEIALDMYRGSGIKRDQVTSSGTPCVRYGELYTVFGVWFDKCVSYTDAHKIQSKKYFDYGDVLFAITGEKVEEIAKSSVYVGHEKCLVGGDIVVLKHNENPKYIAFALSTRNSQEQKSKGKVKSKVVHSSIPALKEIMLPVPALEEQARIASILDRFDTLVNDITQGLPAELAARRRQYEYYRDKLLTFKEKVS